MIQSITSALSKKEIIKAPKSGIPVIFLGGNCKDNDWRKEIEDEFGEDLFLLDPFDRNYNPEKNTHKELAGIVNSDYVIFYRGGKQSTREKEFLDLIGRKKDLVKNFNTLEDLKKFLSKIRKIKLKDIGSKIRKCAEDLLKEAVPHFDTPMVKEDHPSVDLRFEKLDTDSIYRVVQDLLKGKTIKIPRYRDNASVLQSFNIRDIGEDKKILDFLRLYTKDSIEKQYRNRDPESILFTYDDTTNTYKDVRVNEPQFAMAREAKKGATYSKSCIMINLPDDLAKEVIEWGKKNVSDDKLYTEEDSQGREDTIHVTLFYGITSNDPEETAKLFSKIKPFEIRLGLINAFKNSAKYDVLKIEIESSELEKLHYKISDKIENTNDFPTYEPHVTIVYAKKDSINNLIGDEYFKGKTFKANDVVFSGSDKNETKLNLSK